MWKSAGVINRLEQESDKKSAGVLSVITRRLPKQTNRWR